MKMLFICPKCNSKIDLRKQRYYHNEYICWFECKNYNFKTDNIDCKNRNPYDISKYLGIEIVKTYNIFEILQQLEENNIKYKLEIIRLDSEKSTRILLTENSAIDISNGKKYYFSLEDLKSKYWKIINKKEIFDFNKIKENDIVEVKCKILDTEVFGKVVIEKMISNNEFLVKDYNGNKFIISKNEIIKKIKKNK